jgi:uncharacterized protein (DUF885 family)
MGNFDWPEIINHRACGKFWQRAKRQLAWRGCGLIRVLVLMKQSLLALCLALWLPLVSGLATPTPTQAPSPAASPTPAPTPEPSATPVQSAAPSASPDSSPTPSTSASPAPSPTPSATSSPKPSPTPKRKPTPKPTPPLKPDDELDSVSNEFIRGYLNARPLHASALGFHEYDGRISEFTRLAIDAELARLIRFDERLKRFNVPKLSQRAAIDLRLLQTVIAREMFFLRDMSVNERNPIAYARALDVDIYAKRKYAPIDDRVRSMISIENQAANVVIAAKTNLADVLPKPHVELAIQIARDSAEFLKKNLMDSLGDLKDENLRATLVQSNRRAAAALTDYAAWLEKDRLPKATPAFAIGPEKYQRFLAATELVDLAPDKIFELGLSELKREQDVFVEAAKRVSPDKSAYDVFKQMQSEHPAAENLVAEMGRKMETVRRFVADRKLVTIPTEIRAQSKVAPQFMRATSFVLMDSPGPFEKRAADAFCYVSLPDNDWPESQKNEWLTAFNSYAADIVAMRESYPGRYVQALHLNASKASKSLKAFSAASTTGGWAQYCGKMVVDAGYGIKLGEIPTDEEVLQSVKYRMAQAQQAMICFSRLCVSIKMHTGGMSVDDATKFFRENCYYEEKPARTEAMRATFDLAFLTDALGLLEIRKLRDDYEIQEGENFSLKKFHDEFLKSGMPPIRLLREMMLKDQTKWDQVL